MEPVDDSYPDIAEVEGVRIDLKRFRDRRHAYRVLAHAVLHARHIGETFDPNDVPKKRVRGLPPHMAATLVEDAGRMSVTPIEVDVTHLSGISNATNRRINKMIKEEGITDLSEITVSQIESIYGVGELKARKICADLWNESFFD